jgi:hypothetical protein
VFSTTPAKEKPEISQVPERVAPKTYKLQNNPEVEPPANPSRNTSTLPSLPKQDLHETIKILQLKVRKLEELLVLKEDRIRELTDAVEYYRGGKV